MIRMTSLPDPEPVKSQELCVVALTAFVLFPVFGWTCLRDSLSSFVPIVVLLVVATTMLTLCLRTMFAYPTLIPLVDYNDVEQTWFGHRMALPGEYQHIPVVLCATYAFVIAFGALASLMCHVSVATIPLFYVAGLVAFYLWHVADHTLPDSELRRIHMIHHHEKYPQHLFYGNQEGWDGMEEQDLLQARSVPLVTLFSLMFQPKETTSFRWSHEGPLLGMLLAIVFVAHFCMDVPWSACGFAVTGYSLMASLGSAIHMSFHEIGFEWEPYPWYRELRALHMIHHMHRKNYAMVNVMVDVVFGSLMVSV